MNSKFVVSLAVIVLLTLIPQIQSAKQPPTKGSTLKMPQKPKEVPVVIKHDITITKSDLESGAVRVTANFARLPGVGVLIRILPQSASTVSDKDLCDPYAKMTDNFEVRDASDLIVPLPAPLMIGGMWTVKDVENNERSYSAIIPPSIVRQHFADRVGVGAIAVSGGSAAARIMACSYERTSAERSEATVVAAEHTEIVTKDGRDEGPQDLSAFVRSISDVVDGHVTVVIETRVAQTTPLAATQMANSRFRSEKLLAPEAHVVPEKRAVSARVWDTDEEEEELEDDFVVKVNNMGSRTRSEVSDTQTWCVSIQQDKNTGAPVCIQQWSLVVHYNETKKKKTAGALVDVVMSIMTTPLAKDETKGITKFTIHAKAPIHSTTSLVTGKNVGNPPFTWLSAIFKTTGKSDIDQRVFVAGKNAKVTATARDSNAIVTVVDSTETCVDVSLGPVGKTAKGEDLRDASEQVNIVKAEMTVCDIDSCDRMNTLQMVNDRKTTLDFSRNARGKLIRTTEGLNRICYVPKYQLQGKMTITWERVLVPVEEKKEEVAATTTHHAKAVPTHKKKPTVATTVTEGTHNKWHKPEARNDVEVVNEQVQEQEQPLAVKETRTSHDHDHDHDEHWCEHDPIGCGGVFFVDGYPTCRAGYVYDRRYRVCESESNSLFWAFFVAIVVGIIAFIVVACVLSSGYPSTPI
jgi:hypothetical protein